MNIIAISLAILGLASTLTGLVSYFSKLQKNNAPKIPVVLITAFLLGLIFSGFAIALSQTILAEVLASIVLGITAFISSVLGFFLVQSKTPVGDIKVKVGDHILPFQTQTFENTLFTTDNLQGQRTLLKFYRGAWCPYCSAELMMFNNMKDQFATYQVNLIALSGDTPQQAKAHIKRDNLQIQLLADPQLEVVKQYGVEHHKGLGAQSKNIIKVFGVPLAVGMYKYRAMPIPTSILVDENGIILWIDQSEDYRIRASQTRIEQALEQAFKK